MKQYDWTGRSGFGVFLESGGWRIAYHAYDEAVNGPSAVKNWGMHLDSDEMFVLLAGSAVLAVKSDAGEVRTARLIPGDVSLVETGERHILALTPGARVLIAENRNMDNSRTEPADDSEIAQIVRALRAD